MDELTRDRSAMSLEAGNREVCLLLKEGIKVSVPDRERGGEKTEQLRVIDWEHPVNNDFLLVSQFSVTGARGKCRMANLDCRTTFVSPFQGSEVVVDC